MLLKIKLDCLICADFDQFKSAPYIRGFAPPLTLLRVGAKSLIAQAVEAELATLLLKHEDHKLPDGRQVVVRSGYLPERTVQTGLGDVDV